MNSSDLASGDNSNSTSPRYERGHIDLHNINGELIDNPESYADKITPQLIEENEIKMKERIAQCKNVIESLKLQLSEEKEKLNKEKKFQRPEPPRCVTSYNKPSNYEMNVEDYGNSSMYSASVNSKLCCDESLIEYEKQLQKYQSTLTLAQNEKKNAIRKQMLAKAFKLKLMEVENQCNIELLRVKQSLQCLEPLQMIASKWNTSTEDNIYDINNFELMPNYSELYANSGSDINVYKDGLDNMKIVTDACENVSKDESALLE
ncbi:Uncharacterized protein OBRU01_14636 [Operophtera brumata]|uniref:Uncharacterized protein n=1 Tax=Operophtera brumata TaxID=104452 RepID=A0A0L7L5R9_OPEBR|nr:Uncharacterized protein OBRU01_14636 [Operophtera brumata]